MHAFDVFPHRPVDRLAVAHVGDIDHHLHQMLHPAAAFLDQLFDVLHDFVGLFDRIVACDVLGGIELLRALPAQIDRPPALRDDRLAQIVVELLLGVGVFGVELAVAVVGHVGLRGVRYVRRGFYRPDSCAGCRSGRR